MWDERAIGSVIIAGKKSDDNEIMRSRENSWKERDGGQCLFYEFYDSLNLMIAVGVEQGFGRLAPASITSGYAYLSHETPGTPTITSLSPIAGALREVPESSIAAAAHVARNENGTTNRDLEVKEDERKEEPQAEDEKEDERKEEPQAEDEKEDEEETEDEEDPVLIEVVRLLNRHDVERILGRGIGRRAVRNIAGYCMERRARVRQAMREQFGMRNLATLRAFIVLCQLESLSYELTIGVMHSSIVYLFAVRVRKSGSMEFGPLHTFSDANSASSVEDALQITNCDPRNLIAVRQPSH